jgi:hypothetical protein
VKEPDVITETLPSPAFARDGEPCAACGAPLAGDQRYCLHCGVRRREARLEFLDVLDADVRAAAPLGVQAAPVFAAPPAPGGLNDRLQAHSGALALAAIMLLTLIAGLLLGHWVTAPRSTAASAPPAPQVIRIEGGGGAAAAAPAATADGSAAGGASLGAAAGAKAGKAAAKAPKDAVSVGSLGNKKALDQAVKKGKPITTGGSGKLPPKDNKAPGDGTSFQTIG